MTDDEVEELGRMTLHGPVPANTVRRLWMKTLALMRQQVDIREVMDAVDEYLEYEIENSKTSVAHHSSAENYAEASFWQKRISVINFISEGLRAVLVNLPRPKREGIERRVSLTDVMAVLDEHIEDSKVIEKRHRENDANNEAVFEVTRQRAFNDAKKYITEKLKK